MKTSIPLLLTVSTLFFVANADAKTYNKNAHGKKYIIQTYQA
jgi:hypothetical protein